MRAFYLILWRVIFIPFNYLSCQSPQYFSHEGSLLSVNRLKTLSDVIENNLTNIHEEYTKITLLSKRDGRLVAEDVNAENILDSLMNDITKVMNNDKAALEKIVDALELATKDFQWEDELESNFTDSFYVNTRPIKAKPIIEDDEDYEEQEVILEEEQHQEEELGVMDDILGVKVNRSYSAVHIPVEIYEGYPEITNGLKWSSILDDVFRENAGRDPKIGWQFFSSQKGFTRFYPAVPKWYIPPPYDPVDLFDSRRRPWYIQAVSSPKDVVILVDRSGSLHGQTFTITKFAVETFIDTLGENDFVNVAAFNETTSWVSEIVHEEAVDDFGSSQCSAFNESLIQATNINKKALASDIQLLQAKGIANFSDALLFAYDVFKKRSEGEESGVNCHKIIALFSDGGSQAYEEALRTIQNDSDTADVRIFTYAIGPHPTPTAILKGMACQTGGRHTVITTSSGVRSKIQDSYLDVIAEGLAASDKHSFQYTSSYTSALTNNLTITITLPVFNLSRSLLDKDQSELLGVAGVDIPIPLLQNMVSRETLGPLGYMFMVNHNGFLAMHPNIHAQASYLEDALHLDFLDVDVDNETLVQARKHMVLGQRGSVSFPGPILIDMKHVFDGEKYKKYTFLPILDSAFSLGIFSLLPSRHLNVIRPLPLVPIDTRTSILAPWNFCGSHQSMPKSDLLNIKILANDKRQCDDNLLNDLMWAQDWTNVLIDSWNRQTINQKGVINWALFTRFGLSRVVDGRITLNETSSTPPNNFGFEWRDPAHNPALKVGILRNGLSLFPHRQGAFLSLPARVNNIVAAAVGVNLTSNRLDEILEGGMLSSGILSNHSIIMVVDESAFIVASSYYKKSSGEFLGTRWPLLLEKLVEAGIFKRVNMTDFQAMCQDVDPIRSRVNSAPLSMSRPFGAIYSLIVNLFSTVYAVLEFFQCVLIQGFFSTSSVVVQPVSAVYKSEPKRDTCIMQHVIYYLNEKKREFSGNISCLEDTNQVLVQRLNSVNAILVAVDHSLVNFDCDGWRQFAAIPLQPSVIDSSRMRIVHSKEIACRSPRERRPSSECEATRVVKACNNQPSLGSSIYLLTAVSTLIIVFTSRIASWDHPSF